MVIPQDYIIHKFYQYAGYPRHKKITNTYEGGCCLCKEGSSWGRKRRLYYIVSDDIICCHNCGWYGNPGKWIHEVSGLSWSDIFKETQDYDTVTLDDQQTFSYNIPEMPGDCVNLSDTHQLRYYSNNDNIKKCLDVIAARRLDTAVNRPKSLFMSLNDKTHKNRLLIPFYNTENKVSHYQTRRIDNDGTPKYLSKINSEKTLFNVDKLSDPDDVFIFEGPVDSFFVRDSVAVAGIQETSTTGLTPAQQIQLGRHMLSRRVWVLDNDATGHTKCKKLLERDECVFVWPRELRGFKDFNDVCVKTCRDEISREFILKHTYCGIEGLVRLGLQK